MKRTGPLPSAPDGAQAPASEAGAGEFDLIRRHFAPLAASHPAALGLTDDAALLTPPERRQLVLTTDTIVAGRHYPDGEEPGDVARRLLRVNLSDLAAMGARPEGYLLNTAWPRNLEEAWIAAFAAALAEDQARYGIALFGGDTVSTPGPATFTLTAIGSVRTGAALLRGRARPGDMVCVSGTIGDGVFGLRAVQDRLPAGILDAAQVRDLAEAFRRPEPRLVLGQALAERALATAAADVSDGLLADLRHICEASGVVATVRAAAVPLSPAGAALVRAGAAPLLDALTGGDDYELVFTAPPTAEAALQALSREVGVPIVPIGSVAAGGPERGGAVTVLGPDGRPLTVDRLGFQHL